MNTSKSDGIKWGPFTLRVPFIHITFRSAEFIQGLVISGATAFAAAPIAMAMGLTFNEADLNSILGSGKADILEIINTGGIGNYATFELQISKLLENSNFNYLYFAEDDYLYQENFVDLNLQLLNKFQYATGYYHPDYVNFNLHKSFLPKENCPQISTTCSFWTTRSVLLQDVTRLHMYRKLGDLGFWLLLTCSFRQILYRFLLCLCSPRELKLCSRLLRTLFVKESRFLFSNPRELAACYSSTSTHVDEKYVGIGWV